MIPDAAVTALFIIGQITTLVVLLFGTRRRPQDAWRCPSCGRDR